MKRKRQKRSTILRVKIITYMIAILMMSFYTSSGISANDDIFKLLHGVWLVFIIAGLMLYLRWQKLGALLVMGAVLLQGLALVWVYSLYALVGISTLAGSILYILPMLLVGGMLWLLKAPSSPPDEQNMMRDFIRLEDKHDTSHQDGLSNDEEENQRRRLRFTTFRMLLGRS